MRRLSILSLLLLLPMVATTLVSATGTITSVTGPIFSGGQYTWTVQVSALSNPEKFICLTYNTGGSDTTIGCTCDNPVSGSCNNVTGGWTCTLAAQNNTTVNWDIDCWTSGSSGGTCGSDRNCSGSTTGSFSTGPNAITLLDLNAKSLQPGFWAKLPAIQTILIVVVLVALTVTGAIWRRRLASNFPPG
jgi:hypothetical protein